MNRIKKIFGINILLDPIKNLETLKWTAPETLEGMPPTKKSDVYSFGLVLWSLVSRTKPFSDISTLDKLKDNHKKKIRPIIPQSPPMLQTLITNCWSDNIHQRPSIMNCISQLESLIVSTAIPDPRSASFWKTHFSDHIIVDWNTFLHHFLNDLNLYPSKSDINQLSTGKIQDTQLLKKIKCLRLMLVTKENTDQKEFVKIDKFGWVVSWFGSINTNFVDNMINLSDKSWFHGDISGRMAEYQLKNKPVGTFLVRLSVASYGSYTLSYVTNTTINHYRCTYSIQTNNFEAGGIEYNSLSSLINSKSQIFELTEPCLGSKYAMLDLEDNFGYPHPQSSIK